MNTSIKRNTLSTAVSAALLAAVVVPGMAMATPVAFELPTATVVGYVTVAVAFVSAVGAAVLGLIYIARAWKWGRKAG